MKIYLRHLALNILSSGLRVKVENGVCTKTVLKGCIPLKWSSPFLKAKTNSLFFSEYIKSEYL
jgi:hypothetical protein